MACATPVGDNIQFGIPAEEAGLLTEEVSATRKKKRKEAMNGCGDTSSVAWYDPTSEVTIKGKGSPSNATLANKDVGDVLALANATLLSTGTTGTALAAAVFYIDEIQVTLNQEEFQSVSANLIAWDNVP